MVVENSISKPFIEVDNGTSVETPANVSGWDVTGLTQELSVRGKPAREKESSVNLECEAFPSRGIFPDSATVPSVTIVLISVYDLTGCKPTLQSCGRDLMRPEWDEVKPNLEAEFVARELWKYCPRLSDVPR